MEEKMIRVTTRIMGEDYTIRGRASEEHIQRIAAYVDEKMLQISEAYPKLGTSRVAVLAAINMADELFKMREQYEQLTRLLEEEWSQRHTAGREAAASTDATTSREGKSAARPVAPRETQLSAFGEPAEPAAVARRPSVQGPLTGDALPPASHQRSPTGLPAEDEPPEDEG